MSIKTKCEKCKGTGVRKYLEDFHGDNTYEDDCNVCKGKGFTHVMTEEEENDYWADYWG